MRVAIAGAGNVGLFIAEDLRGNGHEVLLLEQDPSVVGGRTKVDPGIEWHLCDACELDTLKRIRLDECDVLIAATGDDEDNLVVSMLGKQEFGVPHVIARVNHPKNEWLFNESWGVDVAVSTPHLITSLVEEAVSVGQLVNIFNFEGGQTRLVEVTLAENSPIVDKAVQDLEIPRDAAIVALIRGEHVLAPRGNALFEKGDQVLALVTAESESDIRTLLTGPQDKEDA